MRKPSYHEFARSRAFDFIQYLFEKYANSHLTRKSDRKVAISGLVKRMEGVLGSEYRYGVFDVFIHRLFLWKRCGETDDNETHYRDQHLPSWSWMIYSRISFLPTEDELEVPRKTDLRFDTVRAKVLLIQVMTFENCTTVQGASDYTILDEDLVDVGCLSFDMLSDVCFQHCVVIGMKREKREKAHSISREGCREDLLCSTCEAKRVGEPVRENWTWRGQGTLRIQTV